MSRYDTPGVALAAPVLVLELAHGVAEKDELAQLQHAALARGKRLDIPPRPELVICEREVA